jgi:hypothetical protein
MAGDGHIDRWMDWTGLYGKGNNQIGGNNMRDPVRVISLRIARSLAGQQQQRNKKELKTQRGNQSRYIEDGRVDNNVMFVKIRQNTGRVSPFGQTTHRFSLPAPTETHKQTDKRNRGDDDKVKVQRGRSRLARSFRNVLP